jgi:hypothetical protein
MNNTIQLLVGILFLLIGFIFIWFGYPYKTIYQIVLIVIGLCIVLFGILAMTKVLAVSTYIISIIERESFQSPVQIAPVQSTPVQSTPLQSTSLQSTPLQSTPLQSTPVQSTPVQPEILKHQKQHNEHPQSCPTNVKAVLGDGEAIVSFSEVPDATFYSVIAYPDIISAEGTSSPIIIKGLVNGTDYTFTVKAHNEHGFSSSSKHSNRITMNQVPLGPAGTPGSYGTSGTPGPSVPNDIRIIEGDKKITIYFSAQHGLSYKVAVTPGDQSVTDIGSPMVLTGLKNGISYTVSMIVSNEIGSSEPFIYPFSVTPLAESVIPQPPSGVKADPKNYSALIHFTESDGATLYTITSHPGNQTTTGLHSPILFPNLMNGTSYTFTIIATNDRGSSIPSAPSSPVTPISVPIITTMKTNRGLGIVPEPPTHLIAHAGNGSALIEFVESRGASSYTVISKPGNIKANGLFSPIHIESLENGTSYSFTVIATNSIGESAPSEPSNTIIPKI